MSRFYQELHDRELLVQAAITVSELQRRGLVDVLIPDADKNAFEKQQSAAFPRRLANVSNENGRLMLIVEESFFY